MPHRLPYFKFYPWDWETDDRVQLLSLEEKGAFISLLIAMWKRSEKEGTVDLPDSDPYIAAQLHVSITDWKRLRAVLVDGEWAVLRVDPERNTIYSKKLRQVYVESLEWTESRRKNGKNGGRPPKNAAPNNLVVSTSLPNANPVLSTSQPLGKPSENLPGADLIDQKKIKENDLVPDEPEPHASATRVRHPVTDDIRRLNDILYDRLFTENHVKPPRNWRSKNVQCLARLADQWSLEDIRQCANWMWRDEYWQAQFDSWATLERAFPKWLVTRPKIPAPIVLPGIKPSEDSSYDDLLKPNRQEG